MQVRNAMVSFGRNVRLATESEVQIGARSDAISEILFVDRRDWKDFHGSNTLCEDLIAPDVTTNGEASESISVMSVYPIVMLPTPHASVSTSQ